MSANENTHFKSQQPVQAPSDVNEKKLIKVGGIIKRLCTFILWVFDPAVKLLSKAHFNRIGAYVRRNLGRSIVFVLVLYGLVLASLGVKAGVYITSEGHRLKFVKDFIEWLTQAPILATEDAYEISFYASASQDFWFFAFIGLIVSIPSIRNPSKDSLRTKIMHIYSDLDEQHSYMPYLEKMLDKHSCIISSYQRKVTLTTFKNGLLHIQFDITITLKNIHYGIELNDAEFGKFSMTPDPKVLRLFRDNWGELISFKDSDGEHIYPRTEFRGEKHELKPYPVKLKPNEARSYNSVIRTIIDPSEKSVISLGKFLDKGKFVFLNQTKNDFCICAKVMYSDKKTTKKLLDEVHLTKGKNASLEFDSVMPDEKIELAFMPMGKRVGQAKGCSLGLF